MIVKTKKIGLEPKIYVKIGMRNVIREQWWLPVAIFAGIIVLNLLLNLVYSNIWIYFLAPLGVGGYFLFWWIQFYGAAQLPQNKVMFEKFNYEIDSRHILMKVNAKEGMQLQWNMIKKAEMNKDNFTLYISKGQFVYLPFKGFNTDNDIKFMEVILKRKNLLPDNNDKNA